MGILLLHKQKKSLLLTVLGRKKRLCYELFLERAMVFHSSVPKQVVFSKDVHNIIFLHVT